MVNKSLNNYRGEKMWETTNKDQLAEPPFCQLKWPDGIGQLEDMQPHRYRHNY